MGALWAKWRKKTSTSEVLDSLQSEIRSIESFGRDTAASHKKTLGYLLAYFSVLYLVAAAVAYFRYFHHPHWQDFMSQFKLMLPFLIAPLIFMLIKRVLTWWYHRKMRKNEVKLVDLKKRKAKILNEVMETETYKVAKEILEKFAPEQLVSKPSLSKTLPVPGLLTPRSSSSPSSPVHTARPNASSGSSNVTPALLTSTGGNSNELRRRANAGAAANNTTTPLNRAVTTAAGRGGGGPNSSFGPSTLANRRMNESLVVSGTSQPQMGMRGPAPGPPLPRPVMPRERGYMDRMVEYLVGDGPSNRFALICKQCQSHNGMALREEFEYIAYRCCYCHYWNPARKERPVAPRLPQQQQGNVQLGTLTRQSSTESSEEDEAPAAKAVVPQRVDEGEGEGARSKTREASSSPSPQKMEEVKKEDEEEGAKPKESSEEN